MDEFNDIRKCVDDYKDFLILQEAKEAALNSEKIDHQDDQET